MAATAPQVAKTPVLDVERVRRDFPILDRTVNGRPLSTWGGSLSESAVRVPLIVNWPGTTPPSQFCHHLIDFSDFFPTFAELAGLLEGYREEIVAAWLRLLHNLPGAHYVALPLAELQAGRQHLASNPND